MKSRFPWGLGPLLSHIHALDLLALFFNCVINSVSCRSSDSTFLSKGFELDGDPIVDLIHVTTQCGKQGLVTRASGCDLWVYGSKGIIGVINDGKEIKCRKINDNGSTYFDQEYLIEPDSQRFCGTAAALDRHISSNVSIGLHDTQAALFSQRLLFACVQSILDNGSFVDPRHLEPSLLITGRSGNLYA